jgi:hypothetical protein
MSNFTARHALEQCVKRRTVFATLGTGNARVFEHLHYGPAVAVGDRVQFTALIGGLDYRC